VAKLKQLKLQHDDTLSDDQVSSCETLIGKLNDSLIKSRIENGLQKLVLTRRVTSGTDGTVCWFLLTFRLKWHKNFHRHLHIQLKMVFKTLLCEDAERSPESRTDCWVG